MKPCPIPHSCRSTRGLQRFIMNPSVADCMERARYDLKCLSDRSESHNAFTSMEVHYDSTLHPPRKDSIGIKSDIQAFKV